MALTLMPQINLHEYQSAVKKLNKKSSLVKILGKILQDLAIFALARQDIAR